MFVFLAPSRLSSVVLPRVDCGAIVARVILVKFAYRNLSLAICGRIIAMKPNVRRRSGMRRGTGRSERDFYRVVKKTSVAIWTPRTAAGITITLLPQCFACPAISNRNPLIYRGYIRAPDAHRYSRAVHRSRLSVTFDTL